VPVPLLFEKATQNLEGQAEEHGIALGRETLEELPKVMADANKVTWVLNNLISNALRYTETGGNVTLSAHEAGHMVHLSVADDGAGIPYEHQPEIFDKFVQVEADGVPGGSGLGLAICKEIVEALGGRIWVDSTPGEGSTFTFTLPTDS
jgi:NtrC-family two-component system sensor histidine kinase KinB